MDIDVSYENFEAILNKLIVFPWHKVGSPFPFDLLPGPHKKVMHTHGTCAMSIENALM